jgi:hypothetical protein
MNKFFTLLFAPGVFFSCTTSTIKQKETPKEIHFKSSEYELHSPKNQTHLLILFPCFPCDIENTKTEFDIIQAANKKGIAVLLMNFNQHLWLEENEKKQLKTFLESILEKHHLNTKHVTLGGFSSGGNVSLLLSNYLHTTKSKIKPEKAFIADSPIDLLGIYESAIKNIKSNYAPESVEEAKWIVESFEKEFGKGDSSLAHYQNKSPYIYKTHSFDNYKALKNIKIRFYTEPDTLWWKENRQTAYEDMNAFYIKNFAIDLNKQIKKPVVEYIETTNKGYRSSGERHPHSWSIIDQNKLIEWILKDQ